MQISQHLLRKKASIQQKKVIIMKLYIKQKVFSLKSRSSIYDAEGNEAYYSEAMIPSIGTKLKIYDRSGAELIYIEQKFWSFLPKYKIFKDGAVVQFDDVAFEVAHDAGEVADIETGVLFGCFVAEGFEGFNRCTGPVLAA